MKVGLTGGLASGKSAVARRLRDAGLLVLDSDQVVAGLYRRGEAGAEAVRALFGSRFLLADGSVDHARLATHVFDDPEALEALEERVHPLVREALLKQAASTDRPVVIEGTLLVEAGFAPDLDLVVSVESTPSDQLERAIARGSTPEQARARLAAQGDGELRRRAAQRIIRNDGALAELLEKADQLANEIIALQQKASSTR